MTEQEPYRCPICGPLKITDPICHVGCERDAALSEVERLREVASTCLAHHGAPFTTWRGACGHLWAKEIDGETCPRCKLADDVARLRDYIGVMAEQTDPQDVRALAIEAMTPRPEGHVRRDRHDVSILSKIRNRGRFN